MGRRNSVCYRPHHRIQISFVSLTSGSKGRQRVGDGDRDERDNGDRLEMELNAEEIRIGKETEVRQGSRIPTVT